jgi:hypothetical protein
MRTYLSVLAIVCAICAVQAWPDVYRESEYSHLSADDVLAKCSFVRMKPDKLVAKMSAATDKNTKMCNGRTIAELLELNHRSMEKCSKQSLKQHLDTCNSLTSDQDDNVCVNVRHYCRLALEQIVRYCDAEVVRRDVADDQFLRSLGLATRQNYANKAKGLMVYYYLNYESPVEKAVDES